LPEALALVAALHIGQCAACRASVAMLEAAGGVLLEQLPPAPLSAAALDQLLVRLDEPVAPSPPLLHPHLPPPLNRVALGRWWPVWPGIRYRPLRTPGSAWGGLLLGQPGRSLPRHGHAGLELTCTLSGAFADGNGTYGVGDLCEPDLAHDQPPVVVGHEPCLCVIASEGMHLRGLMGLAQRLFW
jgi:putative transcriptional regulator